MTRPELRAALAQAHSALHSGETCDAALHDEITAALDAEAGAGGGAEFSLPEPFRGEPNRGRLVETREAEPIAVADGSGGAAEDGLAAPIDLSALAEAMWFEGLTRSFAPGDIAGAESLIGAYRGIVKHRAALRDAEAGGTGE